MFTSKFLSRIGTIAIVLMLTLSNVQTARAVSNDFLLMPQQSPVSHSIYLQTQ